MDYYCEVFDKLIKPESKYKHNKSNTQKEFATCKDIKRTTENLDINKVDRAFYEYVNQLNKKYDYYLVKCQFILVFKDNKYCPYVSSIISDNKTMISWRKFFRKGD